MLLIGVEHTIRPEVHGGKRSLVSSTESFLVAGMIRPSDIIKALILPRKWIVRNHDNFICPVEAGFVVATTHSLRGDF